MTDNVKPYSAPPGGEEALKKALRIYSRIANCPTCRGKGQLADDIPCPCTRDERDD